MGLVVVLLDGRRLVRWGPLRDGLGGESQWGGGSQERTTHLCKKGHKLADAAALVEAKGGEVLGGAEEGGGGGGGLCDGQQRDGKDLHGGGGGVEYRTATVAT